MPFDRAGNWRNPTAEDIEAFKAVLEQQDTSVQTVQPSRELIKAIESTMPNEEPNLTTAEFFEAVSRMHGEVDIVIPVYGGLHVLKECVASIEARTNWPYNLIFVDDCSPDPEVDAYLNQLCTIAPMKVFRNRKNRGFAATVNRGVAAGEAPYVVVLNSDVLVTQNWLTKMIVAMESNEKNIIVNPVTNNTALVNVDMYPGRSYLDMNIALERQSRVRYPEVMPTGFCMMVRRNIWNELGPFDEAFGSYGEETDWWFRAIKMTDEEGYLRGYRAVLADNCYIFHERGTSFSQLGDVQHQKQRQAGSARFHQLHPDFGEWQKGFNSEEAVMYLRGGIPARAFQHKYKGNVAWAVKSCAPCGAMYYIADVANHLIEEGYNVKICLIPEKDEPGTAHALVANLHTRPYKFSNMQEFMTSFSDRIFDEGVLFASQTELTAACKTIMDENPKIRALNHVQSYDVDLAKSVGRPEMIPTIEEAYRLLPNLVSSDWVKDKIIQIGGEITGWGVGGSVILPGVNPDLFHDRDRENGDERPTIAIIFQQMYNFKGSDRGVEVAKEILTLARQANFEIRVLAIGVDSLPEVPGVVAVGSMSQAKIADMLGTEIDVLVDPAISHSYGLPALEALYSGVKVVCWDNGGINSYADEFPTDSLAIYPNDAAAHQIAATAYQMAGLGKIVPEKISFKHHRHSSVEVFQGFLEARETETREDLEFRIRVIAPHLRKHGGPTTLISAANILAEAGNDVSMSMVYTDWNPEVLAGAHVPVSVRWDKVPADTDVTIINSDNPYAEQIMNANKHSKYIMYKLSHNPRFKSIEADNLNLPWDHIVTSTEWLRQVCLELQEGWQHKLWAPELVTTIGWYHYGHPIFNQAPTNRPYYGDAETGFRVGTLIHDHPTKGSEIAMKALMGLKRKYEAKMHIAGVGEVRASGLPGGMQYFRSCNRLDLAHVFKQLDIWLGASYSEGLGRMALENMSAGVAVVTTDTGAEFLQHEENCLLYKPGDAQAAAEAVDRLVQDKELFSKLVINGYTTAVEAANWHPYQTKFLEVIGEVMT